MIRRQRTVFGLGLVAVVATTLLLTALQKPLYEARASILVRSRSASVTTPDLVGRMAGAVTDERVRGAVRGRLGVAPTVRARPVDTSTIEVVAASDSANAAAVVADAYASAYAELAANDPQAMGVGGADVEIEPRPAVIPDLPVRPRPLRNAMLALLAGAVVAVAGAALVDRLEQAPAEPEDEEDDVVTRREDLEASVHDLRVLAEVPPMAGTDVASSASADAYRALLSSIQFLVGRDRSLRVLQVTGPLGGEGKTTIAANLGVALAVAGRSVVVVGCDLRRPHLHNLFGVPGDVGFTSVVAGEAPLSAALQSVAGEDHLLVLPGGPPASDPSEVLASDRAAEVLGALRTRADLVLIDSPSVLSAPEALVLASHADGTLVVAKADVTRRTDWIRTVETLRQAEARLVGAVLTGATGRPPAYQWADGDTHHLLDSPYGVDTPSPSAVAP